MTLSIPCTQTGSYRGSDVHGTNNKNSIFNHMVKCLSKAYSTAKITQLPFLLMRHS